MNSSKSKKVTIPADMMAEFDSIPDRGMRGRVISWTAEQDALLVHLMETKIHAQVWPRWQKKFGWGGRDSLTKRYKELTNAV